jgi:hypothetical protein
MLMSYYESIETNPFGVNEEEAAELRLAALYSRPSPTIVEPRDVEEMMGMNDVPEEALALYRRASTLRLSPWEKEAIRRSLQIGKLREIWEEKQAEVPFPDMVYLRVDCYVKSIQAPCVLEIWPGRHYSFMHEHSDSTGIVFALAGRVDAMVYASLDWNAKKAGLISVDRGNAAWLNKENFQVHRLFCPLPRDEYAATFHIYSHCKDEYFRYIDEKTHELKLFETKSDINWFDLLIELEKETPRYRKADGWLD